MVWGYLTIAIFFITFGGAVYTGWNIDKVLPMAITILFILHGFGYCLGLGLRLIKAHFWAS